MQRYKIIAIVVVVIVVVAAAAVALSNHDDAEDSTEVNLISGLEGVGSGIYAHKDKVDTTTLFEYDDSGNIVTRYHDGVGNVAVFRSEGWAGKTFGVPTVGSIQYYQIKTIVEVYLNDSSYLADDSNPVSLRFVAGNPGSNQVGYTVTQGAATRIAESNPDIGITWDPQYSALVVGDDAPYDPVITTDLLFPHVTCCVLYGNADYIKDNPETTERLVWSAMKATDWLNAVFAEIKEYNEQQGNATGHWTVDQSSEAQVAFLKYAKQYAGGDSSGLTDQQILNSFNYIEYAWGDEKIGLNTNNPMSKIKQDIANQTDTLYNIGGLVNNSLESLGFSNSTQFAESFVDDTAMKNAIGKSYVNSDYSASITFAVIVNDLHQLPIHLAAEALPGLSEYIGDSSVRDDVSLYEQVGLTVNFLSAPGSSGVVTEMTSKQAEFGVAAQPGVIIYDINNKQTTA